MQPAPIHAEVVSPQRGVIRSIASVIWILTQILAILGMVSFFLLAGTIGGVVMSAWESVKEVDLSQLDYQRADTWKQHLEIYSSVCTAQTGDTADFLLQKINRLKYEKIPPTHVRKQRWSPGQYSLALDEAEQNGTIEIFIRGFHYPRADQSARDLTLQIRNGKISAIQELRSGPSAGPKNISRFRLEPELISEIYDQGGAAREIVTLNQMPESLLWAFLAVEDKRFYTHWGIDTIRVFGAFLYNLKTGQMHGASTITMQLSRNIYYDTRKLWLRKVKESLLAVRIESDYSKDEILERYLNFINLGRYGTRDLLGVQEAAKSYFGKPASELEIHECATLAGIPKSPPRYSPVRNPQRCKVRRNLILKLMRNNNFITQDEYLSAIRQPLEVQKLERSNQQVRAYHFLDYIHSELKTIESLKGQLYNQGLKAYTTIDISMQQVANVAVGEHLRELDQDKTKYPDLPNYDENKHAPNGIDPIKSYLQAGLIAIEPQTGYIKAMVGGRDYYVTRQTVNFYNRAVQAKRQPGSAFKPIVLAAMFSQPSLATPATVLTDEPWFTEGKPGERWAPRNYSKRGVGVHFGDVTIRTIIEKSINVAMARLMNETPLELQTGVVEGITRTLKLAKQMGITSPLRPFPALALGASDLTLLEITSAYGSFANEGIYAKPISIQFVENRAGEILIENQVSRHRVLDQNVSYLVTHLLEGVIKNGTGRRVRTMGLTRPSAGKTGTTNDFTDAWFTGYVPNLSVGVWVGFDDPQKSADQEGAKGALPIWARFMLDGLRGEVQDFRLPAGVIFKEIDKETGLLAYEGKCSPENIVREAFLTGQEPKVLCNAHD